MSVDFVSLPLGLIIEAMLFGLLYRFSPLNGVQAAVVTALASLALYLPWSLLHWRGMDVFVLHVAVFLLAAYLAGILTARRRAGGRRRFHWAPTLIILFFVLLIVVDGVFVTLSMRGLPQSVQDAFLPQPRTSRGVQTRFPGVEPGNLYQREAEYNAMLEQHEAQRMLGWQVRKGWLGGVPAVGEEAVFQVSLRDRDGRPVTGMEISGSFLRPADASQDRSVVLREVQPGIYRSALRLPLPGLWSVRLAVRNGSRIVYRLRASTSVKTPPAP